MVDGEAKRAAGPAIERRTFLGVAGAALVAAGCRGLGAGQERAGEATAPGRPADAPPLRGVFDAHTHIALDDPRGGADALLGAMKAASVEGALVMASSGPAAGGGEERTPLGLAAFERIAQRLGPKGPLVPVAGVSLASADAAALERTRAAARRGLIRGLKIYLGYQRAWASDERYRPYYRLAGDLGMPVMLHTGDTNSRAAHLKYAQPLTVDEVAVEHPEVRFILAHLGNPWTLEAAEVVYKNPNVYADVSAFAVGDDAWFRAEANAPVLDDVVARVRQAFLYAEAPGRFLYGSDWPLVPMAAYRDVIRRAIPEAHHAAVFRDNARRLFGIA